MLIIRLSRYGRKKQPSYRVIISEKHKDTHGDYLEQLGYYNPRAEPKLIKLNAERIKYWLSQGAQASDTVHNLLVTQGIVDAPKHRKGRITKQEEGKETPKAQGTPKVQAEAKKEQTGKPEKETPKAEAVKKEDEAKPEASKSELPKEETPISEAKTGEPDKVQP